MRTDEEVAFLIKEKVAELNQLINEATEQELDVSIHQKFLSKDKTISVNVSLQIKL